MKNSKDKEVEGFLKQLALNDCDKFNIVQDLRYKVFKIHPHTKERFMYGGIMFSLENDYGGIFVSKNHISFEFSNGYKMKDTHKQLEGTGKFRRHLKFKNIDELATKKVDFYIKQATL